MVIKTKAPRWYSWQNGQIVPMYEVPVKNKKLLKLHGHSGMKNCTLREARELRLLPSVTSVLSVIDKPDLDNWRVSQAIHSALTLPRSRETYLEWTQRVWPLGLPDAGHSIAHALMYAFSNPPGYIESEDAFAERVLADAEAQANKAAEFGTRIHDAIAALLGQQIGNYKESIDEDLLPYLEHFAKWSGGNIEEVHSVERCVGHPSIGVAGRLDLDCTLRSVGRCVVDFKTQNIRGGKPAFYQDFGIQLAAYAECCYDGLEREAVSVIVPSNEPGPVHVKVWDDLWKLSEAFHHARGLWCLKNDYNPRHQ